MKGLLVFLLLLSSSLRAQEPFNTPNYYQFLVKLDIFNRKLLGCPLDQDYVTAADCHPKQGVMDAKLWKELNERASRIFNVHRKDDKERSRPAK